MYFKSFFAFTHILKFRFDWNKRLALFHAKIAQKDEQWEVEYRRNPCRICDQIGSMKVRTCNVLGPKVLQNTMLDKIKKLHLGIVKTKHVSVMFSFNCYTIFVKLLIVSVRRKVCNNRYTSYQQAFSMTLVAPTVNKYM